MEGDTMIRRFSLMGGGILAIVFTSGCAEFAKALDNAIGQCSDVCTRISECEGIVNAPDPVLPGEMGIEGLELTDAAACVTNCVDEVNRTFNGYSDCQIECIMGVDTCEAIDACWDVSSDAYEAYCLADRDTTPVTDDGEVDNDTTTGSAAADLVVSNPAVEAAVEGSGTLIHFGDSPPTGIATMWKAEGVIDSSSNARDTGSPINTKLCFFDMEETSDGWEVSYCEVGVDGSDGEPLSDTAPITGTEDGDWTIYLEFDDVGSIIFSGNLETDATTMDDVDALVTYYHGMDIWEHSTTSWETEGDACSLSDC